MIVTLSDISLPKLIASPQTVVFDPAAMPSTTPCIGCFSCWLKTPGSCIYKDSITAFTKAFKQNDTLCILSRNCYGSYSPFVKCAIDRSLSYAQPYFTLRHGAMHHVISAAKQLRLIVFAYGSTDTKEQEVMDALVQANAINMNAASMACHHYPDAKEAIRSFQDYLGGKAI